MDILLTVKVKECPYWNYDTHTCTHTCRNCTCMEEGNHLHWGDLYGVKIGEDRYCMLGDVDVGAEIIKAIDRVTPVMTHANSSHWRGVHINTVRRTKLIECANCLGHWEIKIGEPLPTVCPYCGATMTDA